MTMPGNWQLSWHDIIFLVITVMWWAEFRIFSSQKNSEEGGRESFRYILAAILSIILLTIILTFFDLGAVGAENRFIFKSVGLITYGTGLILRYWCSYLLGRYFSRSINVEEDQNLVSRGPYRFLRHPLYLGLFLLTASVPLYMGNVLVVLFAIMLLFLVLQKRIEEEEEILENRLGERYREWKKDRYRLIPFLY